jgi:hypothetical protein
VTDFGEPDRERVADTCNKVVGLAREQELDELHDSQDVEEPLADCESDDEEVVLRTRHLFLGEAGMPRTHSACLSYTWIAVAVVALPSLLPFANISVPLLPGQPCQAAGFMPHDERTERERCIALCPNPCTFMIGASMHLAPPMVSPHLSGNIHRCIPWNRPPTTRRKTP